LVRRGESVGADVSDEKPQSLQGMIREIYGNLDAEDCAMVDREWARMRGYILPNGGSSRLISAETLTSLLRKHITLEWLNASDGHPDITGFDEAAAAILALFAKEK